MKILKRRRNVERDYSLADLEAYIQSTLEPITPSPSFINNLKVNLLDTPLPETETPKVLRYVVLATAGVISGVVIVVTGIRATVTLLGAIGVLRRLREEIGSKPPAAPIHPVV